MSTNEFSSVEESLAVARMIVETGDTERTEFLHRMRLARRLSPMVRDLNRLLDIPAHRPLGNQALKCLGLDRAG